MNHKLKQRWYQFSLKTMLVGMLVLCVGIGSYVAWQRNRHFCITQCFRLMADIGEDRSYFVSLYVSEEPYTPEELREQNLVDEQRDQVAKAYSRAIYRPWERLWIRPEPRAPKRPERFAERIKTSRHPADRDLQLKALVNPGKRQ
jgi:hypothetical protein